MIKIGEFAKICNVTTQTLRYYDSEGVLKADVTDKSSGYRFYSLDAVEKYKQVLFYKNLGFSLDEIKKLQSATSEELREILKNKREELSDCVERFRNQIKTIDDMIAWGQNKPALSEILLLPFEDDPEVVGKWQLCGKLTDENDFGTLSDVSDTTVDKNIIFMPGGTFAWKYLWTKGTLYRISPKYKFAIPNLYKMVERNGERYMTVQFMNDDCIDNGADVIILLYRQVDTALYTEHGIRANVDKTDLPFEDDRAIHGVWIAVDFVRDITDFDPAEKFTEENEIYVTEVRFLARGICLRKVRAMTGNVTYTLRYTKGFVLNDKEMTAEAYEIRTLNGKEFLFVQHKSGDYFYGGITPRWYVFERKNE